MFGDWPDPRFRRLNPELLASLSADDIGDAVVQHVALRSADTRIERAVLVHALPSGTKAVYATWLVDVEVKNGGFNQFFFNPYGELAGTALAGYELFGAEEYAAVMRAAIATYESEHGKMAPYYAADTLEAFSESYKHRPQ
jgi:hypothetical protein